MAYTLMRVLITRPRDDAERVAELLRARGHEPIVSPLMEIRFADGPEIDLEGVQAVLATSANGIRALARRSSRRDLPVFAVGPQTASAAREFGFSMVKDAQGDALALAEAVRRWAIPKHGALVRVAGRQATGDLDEILSERGFKVRTEILYQTMPAESLSKEALDALESGKLNSVMLFSPRSVRIFGECLDRARLLPCCRSITAICISQRTAEQAALLPFAQVRTAEQPNFDAMLPLLR